MIKMLTAYTCEIDDCKTAVSEILEQLDLDHNALGNSVGFVNFHSAFLETGVVKAISDALPFDTVGYTSSGCSVPGARNNIMLTAAVLTSGDVSFSSGVSAPVEDNPRERISELYSRVQSNLPGAPAFFYMIAPIMRNIPGDEFVEIVDELSGGVPIFGSLPSTHMVDFSGVYTFFNGEYYPDALVLTAMSGDIRPSFFLTNMPNDRRIRRGDLITDAEKNVIFKINGISVYEYLESIGLAENGSIYGASSIPMVLTLPDGFSVIRSLHSVTEEGHVICLGGVPVGSLAAFSIGDADYVTRSAVEILNEALRAPDIHCMLLFSCAARKWVLDAQADREMEKIAQLLDGACQYQFSYSGGEICPVRLPGGPLANRFNNFSLVICVI
jgi:hypothetical protein